MLRSVKSSFTIRVDLTFTVSTQHKFTNPGDHPVKDLCLLACAARATSINSAAT